MLVLVVVCLAVAVALVVYAFIALPSEVCAQKEVKNTAQTLGAAVTATTNTGGLGAATQQQALSAGTDFVKAVATLGDSMSKLKSGAQALLIAFALIVFAGIAAGVDDKVPDKGGPTAAATPAP